MEVLPKDLGRLPREEAEKALFDRYREDASAFAAIYEWFGPELLVFIKRNLEGSLRSYAEDILHETFLAFHLKRDQLEPNTKLRGLLYRIAERRVNDEVRAATTQKRHPGKSVHPTGDAHLDRRLCDPNCGGYDEVDTANDAGRYGSKYGAGGAGIYLVTDPKNRPELRDAKIELDDAMARLPASEKQAVELVDLDCHTHASAAEVANVPESTIWSRVRSGRKHLKELLTSTVVLLAIVGAVADGCDSDVRMNLCAVETDEDEACREGGGQYVSSRLSRKGLMRWLVGPDTAREINCCLSLDEEYSVIHREGTLAVCRLARPNPPWLQREDGRVLRLRASHAMRNQFLIPIVLQAA